MEKNIANIFDQLPLQATEIENGGRSYFGNFALLSEIVIEESFYTKIDWKSELKNCEYKDYSDFILKTKLKALIRQMKELAQKPIKVFNQFDQNLHSYFTILYGLCSSQLSFIFNAYTGASLARILS